MAELMDQALEAVQAFEDADEEELYRQLGLRVKAIERDPMVAGYFAPPKAMLEPMGITLGDVVGIGRRAFAQLSRAGYGLICSGGSFGSNFDALLTTLGSNRMTITAGLATLLVAQIGLAPAIAGVVATIAIGKVAPSSVEAVCAIWAAKAGFTGPSTTPAPPPASPTPSA